MRLAILEAEQMVRIKEAAQRELQLVNDSTRKLLRKLNLTNKYVLGCGSCCVVKYPSRIIQLGNWEKSIY